MHSGEVGIEITPILTTHSHEPEFAAQLDALLRRTCQIARAMTGAEQAALQLWVGEDSSQVRKYFSMSEKYAAFRDFRVDPQGFGLHAMKIAPGEVEVLSHPLYEGFGPFADAHPPLRGWLATNVCGDDGRIYGLLQLSDKSGGRDFDESDEANIRELAALIGETLDALQLAAKRRA
jgi:GAF domain-containing protein